MVERLESLSISKEEYYLVKALVLTNSDAKLDEYHSLKKFRDSILSALSDAMGVLRYVLIKGKGSDVSNSVSDCARLILNTSHYCVTAFSFSNVFNTKIVKFRPNNVMHQIQQLLLCLPALRQADFVVRKFWCSVHNQDLVPMNKLFLEMLEASNR